MPIRSRPAAARSRERGQGACLPSLSLPLTLLLASSLVLCIVFSAPFFFFRPSEARGGQSDVWLRATLLCKESFGAVRSTSIPRFMSCSRQTEMVPLT